MKYLIIALLSTFFLTSHSTELSLVPIPNKLTQNEGTFKLNQSISIYIQNDSIKSEALYLQSFLDKSGLNSTLVLSDRFHKNGINLGCDNSIKSAEQYKLSVSKLGISIKSGTKVGIFRAITTLCQLITTDHTTLPCVEIEDSPRFEYRALMLDPARRFIEVEDVKRYLDQMAKFKFNYLHFHLTDDQGWRVEIKKYPLLTQIGSVRSETDGDKTPHKGFYTQDQIKDLVSYAKRLHIDIIPEIDVPGHSVSAIAAYPFLTCKDTSITVRTTAGVSLDLLCAGNEQVYEFYSDVYNELCDLFPSKYFHVGGDEAPLDHWVNCKKCQSLKAKNGYTSNRELMSYFFGRINDVLQSRGKTPLFWYELDVPNYPENSIMYAWRYGLTPEVIERARLLGRKVICAPGEHAYFDYPHSRNDHPVINWGMPLLPLRQVYQFDPGYGLEASKQSHIMGVEATLWGECITDIDRAFYMTYPRALALSEAGWSNMENRDWSSFLSRIKPILSDLVSDGIYVRIPYEDFKL